MSDSSTVERSHDPLARLDRLPIWPYPRLLWATLAGGFFVMFYDNSIIGIVVPIIKQQFQISTEEASVTVTVSLLGFVVGAVIIGILSDLWGRKRTLVAAMALLTVGALASAVSPSLAVLAVSRFVVGVGVGAEIAVLLSYLGELSPAAIRGRVIALTTVIGVCSVPLGPLLGYLLAPHFAWSWRLLLGLGALGGLIVLAGSRYMPESPRWLVARGQVEAATTIVAALEKRVVARTGQPLSEPSATPRTEVRRETVVAVLRRPYVWKLLLLALIWGIYYIGNYAWQGLGPTLLVEHGYSVQESIGLTIGTACGAPVGAVISFTLIDKIERKFLLLMVGSAWTLVLLFIGLFPSPPVVITLGFVATMLIGCWNPALYTVTSEHFPTPARATGTALSDGVGHLGGALAVPIGLGAFEAFGFLGAFVTMAATGAVATALCLLTARRTGRSLDVQDEQLSAPSKWRRRSAPQVPRALGGFPATGQKRAGQ